MEEEKKSKLNLTWPKLIIFAIIAGVYTAIMAMLEVAKDTSFSDIIATFEVWILFGILIIMHSKSKADSALKCFVFFLISQPLVYLIQDVINHSHLFVTYYRYWFTWTVACLPMGFIGYLMKKDKWWGLLILIPILLLLSLTFGLYFVTTVFSFPRHLLTTIFCGVTLIFYPLYIFKNKKIKITGLIISCLLIVFWIVWVITHPYVYSTDFLSNNEKHPFDDTYKAYFADDSFGKLTIVYDDHIEDWFLHAEVVKAGKTEFTLESPTGEKMVYEITIKRDTYDLNRKQ